MDPALAYLEAQELGRIEQHVELRDHLTIPPGVRARAHVVHTTQGLYLVAARSAKDGVAIDLIERGVRLEKNRLLVGEVSLAVPRSKRRALEQAVALARLEREKGVVPRPFPPSRYVPRLSPVEHAFIHGFLDSDELLLVWKEVEREAHVTSDVGPDMSGRGYFVVTDRRAARVVLSSLGDRTRPRSGRSDLGPGRALRGERRGD